MLQAKKEFGSTPFGIFSILGGVFQPLYYDFFHVLEIKDERKVEVAFVDPVTFL